MDDVVCLDIINLIMGLFCFLLSLHPIYEFCVCSVNLLGGNKLCFILCVENYALTLNVTVTCSFSISMFLCDDSANMLSACIFVYLAGVQCTYHLLPLLLVPHPMSNNYKKNQFCKQISIKE